MARRPLLILGCLVSLVLVCCFDRAEGAEVQEKRLLPVADTFVSSSYLMTWVGHERKQEKYVNFGGNEGLSVIRGMMAGAGGFLYWRGTMIRFDLSEIPVDAEIEEARLHLYHYSVWSQAISIHRMTRDWSELEATWFEPCRGCGEWWQGWDEGNYVREPTGTQWVMGKEQWCSWDVTEDVKQLLVGSPNCGWFLKSAHTTGSDWTSASFYSREASPRDLRPYLLVKYGAVPPPAPLTVDITTPTDGATVHETPLRVVGTVSDTSALVTLNGMTAAMAGNTFDGMVPLGEGPNLITAEARDRHSQRATKTITVNLLTKGGLAGTVKDQSTGLPLPAVTVQLADRSGTFRSATTGTDGRYRITDIPFGAFSGRMEKEGYRSFPFSGTVSPGEVLVMDGALSPIVPVITDVAVSEITADSATVRWVTDLPSTSVVEYGATASYGSSSSDSTLQTSHQVVVTNLSSETTYHFRVSSTNAYGFFTLSPDGIFRTLAPSSPVTIVINSPRDGESLLGTQTMVEGTVINATGQETGVIVNGSPATFYGESFVVNRFPLAEGSNSITAVATDVGGNTATTSIVVTSTIPASYLRLRTSVDSGVSPFETTLSIDSNLDLTGVKITNTGPSDVEILPVSPNEYRVRMTTEGRYFITASLTALDGTQTQDLVALTVFPETEIDNLLRAKWEGMRAKLQKSDIEGALTYLDENSREDYRESFELLAPILPVIAQELSDISLVEVVGDSAIYDIRTTRDGVEYSFHLLFSKDLYGLWKIVSF